MIKRYYELQPIFIKNRNNRFYDYLIKKRSLTKEIIDKFELGYNNEYFDSNKGEPLIAKDAITIPFRDNRGRIVAYQSRFIDNVTTRDGRELRYFFTHNLPYVYERGKYIYNLNRVINDYYNRVVIVVEGVIDLMSLACVGINNVITPLQNMITVEMAEILYRYFDKIYFLMDEGESGKQILDFKSDRLEKLEIYKIPIEGITGVKDANDMLRTGVDIKAYMKANKQQVRY